MMRILMLSWEYPPKIVGGIARHVSDLSRAMAEQGEEVTVITCGVQGAPDFEVVDGVNVFRVVMNNPSTPDFLTWVLQLNLNMVEKANYLALAGVEFDIIHGI
jgi:glycogen(starch) synthase